ncbi:MAG TPA: M28 family peptidase [Flavipsychrobacter sp.]|nr:M28 family peptidase [Flavipsychrobacter sp.]
MKQKVPSIVIFLLFSAVLSAQTKADKKNIRRLKADITYLASEELEGRRTSTEGEQKAASFLESRYKKDRIKPYKENYKIPFQFVYGKEATNLTNLTIDGKTLKLHDEFFPMPFSANSGKTLEADVMQDMLEQDNIWLMPLYKNKEESEDAHFDYEKTMGEKALLASKQGATAVIFFDNFGAKYPVSYNPKSEVDEAKIPVLFLHHQAYQSYISKNSSNTLSLRTELRKTELTGTNVAGYIDNKAPYTVVLGAHFDHLGFGEDGSSTYRGKDRLVHNGADDNASGSAGLLQLASWIKNKRLNRYNYLFIHFSGEEMGLLGSKAIVRQMGFDSTKIAYMINMDMIGRLNDSTHALTVGGVGTSPIWPVIVENGRKDFKINVDSSGVGPSDHTSFYHQGIPVLFFFTGIHHDYHKPSDDADKINYNGELTILKYIYNTVVAMDGQPKPKFTPTKQSAAGKVKFKVTMGIMPDYSYENGDGLRVDGVTEDRPAIRAGIKAGDIITQIGDHKVKGIQTYMEALGKFKEGDMVKVKLKRGDKTIELPLIFK